MLFLHDGQGSLSDSVGQLKTLHTLGINIFAFDYRGFGQSANTHPSESRVYEDADAAWNYLTDIRHLDPRSIVIYGTGLGATIAAEAAIRHHESPALVLENPAPPALSLIAADSRTSIIPIRWLFRDRASRSAPGFSSSASNSLNPPETSSSPRKARALARNLPSGKSHTPPAQSSCSFSDRHPPMIRTTFPPCKASLPRSKKLELSGSCKIEVADSLSRI